MPVSPGREARLKPEYAHLYPPLQAGVWEPAGILADRMVAWLLRERRGYTSPERALRNEHFDFRGGVTAPASPEAHSRRHDPRSAGIEHDKTRDDRR
jgi:hypothetical protein